jgi:hypothetical protein
MNSTEQVFPLSGLSGEALLGRENTGVIDRRRNLYARRGNLDFVEQKECP